MTPRKTTRRGASARSVARGTAAKAPARGKPKSKSTPATRTARAGAATRPTVLSLVHAGLNDLRRRYIAVGKKSAGSMATAASTAPVEDALDRLEADYRRLFGGS